MLYIDCTECIPKGDTQFHGGANYGKRMVCLLSNHIDNITVLLPNGFQIKSEMDKSIFFKENIKLEYINDLKNFSNGVFGDILFIPMMPTHRLHIIKKIKLNNIGIKVYVTIHGVRQLDLIPDYFDEFYKPVTFKYLDFIKNIVKYHLFSVIYKMIFKKYIPMFDKVFTVSNDSMQKIQNICQPNYIKHFYCGSINTDNLKIDEKIKYQNYALFVSGGRSEKNLLRCLIAFQRYKNDDQTGLKLIVTGITKEKRISLLKHPQIKFKMINEFVVFLPYVNEVRLRELYTNCKYIIYLSKSEGFGLPLVEACMYEKPILAASLTAMPEVLRSGAFYANPYDVYSIAAMLHKMTASNYEQLKEQIRRRKKIVLFDIKNSDLDFIEEFC